MTVGCKSEFTKLTCCSFSTGALCWPGWRLWKCGLCETGLDLCLPTSPPAGKPTFLQRRPRPVTFMLLALHVPDWKGASGSVRSGRTSPSSATRRRGRGRRVRGGTSTYWDRRRTNAPSEQPSLSSLELGCRCWSEQGLPLNPGSPAEEDKRTKRQRDGQGPNRVSSGGTLTVNLERM